MSKYTWHSNFKLGDKVILDTQGNITGNVNLVGFDLRGVQYEVNWWSNGDRRSAWFSANELEDLNKKPDSV